MAEKMCEGRVCIVMGAGRGIGREYALLLAKQGAHVVVNDFGGARDGTGADRGPAQAVVCWLASKQSADVTGQVIESSGTILGIAEGWRRGPHIDNPPSDPHEIDAIVRDLLTRTLPRTKMSELS